MPFFSSRVNSVPLHQARLAFQHLAADLALSFFWALSFTGFIHLMGGFIHRVGGFIPRIWGFIQPFLLLGEPCIPPGQTVCSTLRRGLYTLGRGLVERRVHTTTTQICRVLLSPYEGQG